MRNRFRKVNCICYHLGSLLQILSLTILLPILCTFLYWGQRGEGWRTLAAFALSGATAWALGFGLHLLCKPGTLDSAGGMLICALGWLALSLFAAMPFVIGIGTTWIDAYFEAMSGFTTTGITVFNGLDNMPHSILFWRSLTQWLGGLGILSFFLAITYRTSGASQLLGAESHKISAGRPAPGLFNTLKILWGIYILFTVGCALLLAVWGMSVFDAICHSFTCLSTGGYSPHDASIAWYAQNGFRHYRLIEYTLTFFMMLGGMNFLVHYRVLTRDWKALYDHTEVRWWWGLLAVFIGLVAVDHVAASGWTGLGAARVEAVFRTTAFQVVSILTTTGFGTEDIGSAWFPALSRQLFLVMMVVGGCVGSTGGGIKVMRIAILSRLGRREIFKICVSSRASHPLVIDGEVLDPEEIQRVAALFFAWMALLAIGGGITAACTSLSGWSAYSGMFSALGNIGPCYISVNQMIAIHPAVKITYIVGMLAGRLEILPVLLLLAPRAWR